MQVWAGTGEPNSRNTISPGGGVYKSTDGGMTWKLMGLEKTQPIGRIVVHPTESEHRLRRRARRAVERQSGARPLQDRRRRPDLAARQVRLRQGGLRRRRDRSVEPERRLGGELAARARPVLPEVRRPGFGALEDRPTPARRGRRSRAADSRRRRRAASASRSRRQSAHHVHDGRGGHGAESEAGQGASPRRKSADGPLPLRRRRRDVDAHERAEHAAVLLLAGARSIRRIPIASTGRRRRCSCRTTAARPRCNATKGIHVDHHAMWIDPNDPERMIVGDDGGVGDLVRSGRQLHRSRTSFAIGQFYNVSYDLAVPYSVCGGLQDNGSWCGPSRRRSGPITNAMWFTVGGGDGFVTQQDPTDPNIIYAESQGGAIARLNYATGRAAFLVKPQYAALRHVRGLGAHRARRHDEAGRRRRRRSASPSSARARARIRPRSTCASTGTRRIFISPHNPATIYIGGNRVLKSTKRGDDLFPISPDLSTADTMKIRVSHAHDRRHHPRRHRRRDVLHDRVAQRVADSRRDSLRRHRRRQRLDDEERRRHVGGADDARHRRARPARTSRASSRRRTIR